MSCYFTIYGKPQIKESSNLDITIDLFQLPTTEARQLSEEISFEYDKEVQIDKNYIKNILIEVYKSIINELNRCDAIYKSDIDMYVRILAESKNPQSIFDKIKDSLLIKRNSINDHKEQIIHAQSRIKELENICNIIDLNEYVNIKWNFYYIFG